MMTSFSRPIAVALGGILMSLSNQQATAQEMISTIIEERDANGDGSLSRDEVPISVLPDFDEVDADGDGLIDDFEGRRWDMRRFSARGGVTERGVRGQAALAPEGTVLRLVQQLDRDGDQRLSPDELPAEHRAQFGRLDLDQDGYIDLQDARILDNRRADQLKAKAASEGARPRAAPAPAGRRTLASVVRMMDTDGDGILQRREAPLGLQRAWDRFDLNGDGGIDMQEADRAAQRAPGS